MIRSTNKNNLQKLFPIPCKSFRNTGIQDGIIIRFKTFYLKIYDDSHDYGYIVKGYKYNDSDCVFEIDVPVSKFRKFASNFTRDDCLYCNFSNIKL